MAFLMKETNGSTVILHQPNLTLTTNLTSMSFPHQKVVATGINIYIEGQVGILLLEFSDKSACLTLLRKISC